MKSLPTLSVPVAYQRTGMSCAVGTADVSLIEGDKTWPLIGYRRSTQLQSRWITKLTRYVTCHNNTVIWLLSAGYVSASMWKRNPRRLAQWSLLARFRLFWIYCHLVTDGTPGLCAATILPTDPPHTYRRSHHHWTLSVQHCHFPPELLSLYKRYL